MILRLTLILSPPSCHVLCSLSFRHLRASSDQIINALFELDSERQKSQVKERRLGEEREKAEKTAGTLRARLDEKDGELREVARRMQQWKLTTARSLAAKLEKKIASELAQRREEQAQNRNIERWLSSSTNIAEKK